MLRAFFRLCKICVAVVHSESLVLLVIQCSQGQIGSLRPIWKVSLFSHFQMFSALLCTHQLLLHLPGEPLNTVRGKETLFKAVYLHPLLSWRHACALGHCCHQCRIFNRQHRLAQSEQTLSADIDS